MGIRHVTPTGAIDLAEWNSDHAGAADAFDITAYGAVAGANSSTGIQAAISACVAAGGGTVYVPPGTFLVNTPIALATNVRILGAGPSSVLQKADGSGTTGVLEATGTVGTGVNLSGNVAQAATSVAAATNPASLVAGDYVLIRDNTYAYGSGPDARNQEINRIDSITGTYTFNLSAPTIGSYATASTAQILKLTPVADARVERIKVTVPVGQDGGCIVAIYATGLTVYDSLITGMRNYAGVQLNTCSRVSVFNNNIRDAQMPDVDHGFGIAIDNSHHIQIAANHFENCMENLFSNKARDSYFTGNVCVGMHDSGVNTHGSGNERILIADNVISGSLQYGIAVGHTLAPATDRDIIIARNEIVDAGASGITVVAGSGVPMSYISVAHNVVVAWNRTNGSSNYGVLVSGANTNLLIQGNVLDGAGIDASGNGQQGIVLASPTDVFVVGNTVRNIANGYGIQADSTTRVTIQSNQLSAISSSNIRSTTTNTDLVVRDNDTDDSTVEGPLTNDLWFNNQFGAGAPVGVTRAWALGSNHAISSATATEVTGLGPVTLTAGTYKFEFTLLCQAAVANTSGIRLGINHTGTAAVHGMQIRYPSTGTTANTGIADDVGAATGQLMEANPQTAFSTTTPNMGNTGFVTTGSNTLITVEGVLTVSATGDLELWHGSSGAVSTTVMAGSSLTVTRTG